MDIVSSVKKFIEVTKIVISIFPAIISAVKTVEQLLPENGRGKDKLALIRAQLEAAFMIVGSFDISFDELWPGIELTISRLVSIFNAGGDFKK